jgi:signal transduction histidine kinase
MNAVDDSAPDAQLADGTPTPVGEPTTEALRALDQVVSQLALSFATASSARVEPLIAEWLAILADFLAVDRITLYEYSEAEGGLRSAYHFRSLGVDPPPTALNVCEIPAVIAALKRGEVLRYERLGDVPEVDRIGSAPVRFRSVLGAPFAVEGALGYLAFSTLRTERRWHDAVIDRLRTIAEILAHGVARKRGEHRREALEPARRAPEFPELLLGIVGHDLRNPLSAVSGLTQLLRAKTGLPADVVRRVAAIDDAAKRMNDMIGTLLDFGETQMTGSLGLARTATDLGAICAQAISAQAAVCPETAIVFEGTASVRGLWDPARLGQLIRELLSSALARAENNPVSLRLELEGELAVLRVRDSGAPIPAQVLRQIFEPLSSPIAAGQSPWAQGVALRLHIAQQIAQSHGGALSIESSREGGTLFTVRLPIASVA